MIYDHVSIRSTLWRHEVSLWGYSGFGQERIRVSILGNRIRSCLHPL